MASDAEKAAWDRQWYSLHPGEGVRPEGYHGEGGGGGGGGGGVSTPNYEEIQRKQLEAMIQANQPAIKGLEESIPEISSKYGLQKQQLEAEKDPLEKRYQNILNDITRREEKTIAESSAQLAREYGKRGIPVSSGAVESAQNKAAAGTREYYAGLSTETGLARESDIRSLQNLIANITPQETAEIRNVRNAIAQLQAGGASSAITNALQIYQGQLQAKAQADAQANALGVAEIQAEASKWQSPEDIAYKIAQTDALRTATEKSKASGAGSGTGSTLDDFFSSYTSNLGKQLGQTVSPTSGFQYASPNFYANVG